MVKIEIGDREMALVKNVILAVVVTFFLVGCQDSNSDVKTVEYFKANNDALAAQMQECIHNPKKVEDPNCVTAKQAALANSSGKLRDLSGFKYNKKALESAW